MKGKIVIVDDDPDILEVMNMILQRSGYITIALHDSSQFHSFVQHLRPDLILMDIWMPEVDGGTLTKQLKQQKQTSQIPVILMSASNQTEEVARDTKADDYITKPFDIDELVKKVEKNLKKRTVH